MGFAVFCSFVCSLCGDENGLRLIVAVVAQICKYTKND